MSRTSFLLLDCTLDLPPVVHLQVTRSQQFRGWTPCRDSATSASPAIGLTPSPTSLLFPSGASYWWVVLHGQQDFTYSREVVSSTQNPETGSFGEIILYTLQYYIQAMYILYVVFTRNKICLFRVGTIFWRLKTLKHSRTWWWVQDLQNLHKLSVSPLLPLPLLRLSFSLPFHPPPPLITPCMWSNRWLIYQETRSRNWVVCEVTSLSWRYTCRRMLWAHQHISYTSYTPVHALYYKHHMGYMGTLWTHQYLLSYTSTSTHDLKKTLQLPCICVTQSHLQNHVCLQSVRRESETRVTILSYTNTHTHICIPGAGCGTGGVASLERT